MSEAFKTAESDRVPKREKLAYALAAIPFTYGYSAIKTLAFPIYNMTLGLSPTLIGLVLSISRLWDAITDPTMGNLSDNARTRWGRRRPFLALGGLLCLIAFPVIWFVPSSFGHWGAFAYFLGTCLFFYTSFTVYSVPYLSMGYELSPDTDERTRVQAWRSVAAKLSFLLMPWVYRLAQSDAFDDTMQGMRFIGIVIGVFFIVFAIPAVLMCRERFAKTAAKQEKIKLRVAMGETFHNRAFLILVGIVMCSLCGTQMVNSLGIYVNSYYIFGGDTKMGATFGGWGGMVYAGVGIGIVPVVTWAATHYGKKTVMAWALAISAVGSASKFFLYTPENPYLQFISIVLLAPSFSAFWIMVDPMKADCADYDESQTNRRREGMYAAVANWFEKLSLTIILLLSGMILDVAHFDVALGGEQTERTFLIIRILFAGVPASMLLLGLVLLKFYPLNEARMRAIRTEMEARRGVTD